MKLDDSNFHPHMRDRMLQRGITRREIEKVLSDGWKAGDSKQGTSGKVFVFSYEKDWEGVHFEEKEIRVYYNFVGGEFTLLTAMARYGKGFSRER
ncbi:MAG: DUF4258 domain-containing protein [Dehalococcoidia bacterium]|nr:DUF4258 domain-containing protein [Dehalococcoidia bacterium]